MEDSKKQRIKELRKILQVRGDDVARKQEALGEAQEAEYYAIQELNLVIRDCVHEVVFSIEENFMDEDGEYLNNEMVTATSTCTICGLMKVAKLGSKDFLTCNFF